jgi:hypothetical protein
MESPENHSIEDLHAAHFANMVMQQGNMALMFLGKIPNPETGETIREPETARMFIEQLEMLETKTKGNLSPEEKALLGQTLMTVRMTFVEESGRSRQAAPAVAETSAPPAPTPPAPGTTDADESKRKFVKKY